jgi:hypothetical protein
LIKSGKKEISPQRLARRGALVANNSLAKSGVAGVAPLRGFDFFWFPNIQGVASG